MRCPKCKFISFDDLSNCAKCANDLSALSAELNGTGIETHLEFFLGPVIQAPNFEDDEFSDSQKLPPIDHAAINFDDTGSGEYAAYKPSDQGQGIDFDESVGIASEDDISIELGDIMPIDLDQLDVTSVMAQDISDTLSLENDLDDFASMTSDQQSDIDLNLTSKFSRNNHDLELNEDFSDIDLSDPDIDFDDTNLGARNDTVKDSSWGDADDTVLAIDSDDMPTGALDSSIDLDSELIAELADSSDDLDATTTLTKSTGEFDAVNLSASEGDSISESTFDLDDSLAIDLSEVDSAEDDTLSISRISEILLVNSPIPVMKNLNSVHLISVTLMFRIWFLLLNPKLRMIP